MVSQRACSGKPNLTGCGGERMLWETVPKKKRRLFFKIIWSFTAPRHTRTQHASSPALQGGTPMLRCVYLGQHRIVIREAASLHNTSRQLYRARGRVRMFTAPTGPIRRPVPHRRTRTSTSPGLGPTGSRQQLRWRNRTRHFCLGEWLSTGTKKRGSPFSRRKNSTLLSMMMDQTHQDSRKMWGMLHTMPQL